MLTRLRLLFCLLYAFHVQALALAETRDMKVTTIADELKDASLVSANKHSFPLIRIAAPSERSGIAPRARYYLQAALHGNEQLTSRFSVWLSLRLKNGTSPLNELNGGQAAFDIVPLANPDGYRANERTNANFVNLNRNFSVLWGISRENPGKTSFSEPETRAIRAMFDANKYTAATDIHGYINWVVAPSAPKTGIPKPIVDQYNLWTSIIRANMPNIEKTYLLKTAGGLGDGGAFEDWAFWEKNVPAFCLEMVSAFQQDVMYTNDGKQEKVDYFERYEAFLFKVFSDYNAKANMNSTAANAAAAKTRG